MWSGRSKCLKINPNSQYVRPTVKEAELMDVHPVVHDAMASTSTSTDQKPDVMVFRPRIKQVVQVVQVYWMQKHK